jgi:sulfide:quinone oxidoreductase
MTNLERSNGGRRIVVAGGGFAGLGAAYTLRQQLQPRDTVLVIEPSGHFVFAPSLVWAALGRPLIHSSFPLRPILEAHDIAYLRSHVRGVDVQAHIVRTDDDRIRYDKLVIATGGRPDASTIPGLAGEFQTAHAIVGLNAAQAAREALRTLFTEPGPVVVGVAQGASYISGVYELVLSFDAALRRAGVRARVPLTFITSEPYLGELGFGQTATQPKLKQLFTTRGIAYRTGVTIDRVRREEVVLGSGETLPATVSVIMPPFTGDVDLWKSEGLTDERGLIPVDAQYRHTRYEDIYAAGVAALFTEPIPPLTGRQAPHTGYLSLRMGRAAGQNVAATLGCGSPAKRPLPFVLDLRILDGDDIGLLLASRGDDILRHSAVRLPGRSAHYLKAAIERYILWQLRTGHVDEDLGWSRCKQVA